MEISMQQLQETLNFIVEGCRERSLTEDREEFIRYEFSRSSANLHGLSLLFVGEEAIDDLINRANDTLIQYRNDALERIAQPTSDLGRSPATSPTVVGQESTPKKKIAMKFYDKSKPL